MNDAIYLLKGFHLNTDSVNTLFSCTETSEFFFKLILKQMIETNCILFHHFFTLSFPGQ